jgi:hypothetical protein
MTHELKPIFNQAEKLSALRTEDYFKERAARGDVAQALEILNRAGVGNPPWDEGAG